MRTNPRCPAGISSPADATGTRPPSLPIWKPASPPGNLDSALSRGMYFGMPPPRMTYIVASSMAAGSPSCNRACRSFGSVFITSSFLRMSEVMPSTSPIWLTRLDAALTERVRLAAPDPAASAPVTMLSIIGRIGITQNPWIANAEGTLPRT